MSSEQTRGGSMTHEKRAREIADGLAGYIGNPKRRDELAEDIVDALRAVAREASDKDEMGQSAHDMNELVVTNLLRIFGWPGGTAHQIIVRVKMLNNFHKAWVAFDLSIDTSHPNGTRALLEALEAADKSVRRTD